MANKTFKNVKHNAPKHEPEVAKAGKTNPALADALEIAKAATAELVATGTLAPTIVPGAKPEDQKTATSGDQKSAPTPKKKSEQVQKWKDTKAFGPEQVITVVATGEPKKRDAGKRFALYKTGQTVAQYQAVMKEAMSRTAKQTMGDIRWDHAKGFISIK